MLPFCGCSGGAAQRKNGLCGGGVSGVTGPSGRPKTILTQLKRGWGLHYHVEAAVDWCSLILLALHVCTIYTTEISHFTIQKDLFCFVLFAIFILHSRESELYRYTLDGTSALAWELPFSRFMGNLSST